MLAAEKWKDGDIHPNTANYDSESRLRKRRGVGAPETTRDLFKTLIVKNTPFGMNGLGWIQLSGAFTIKYARVTQNHLVNSKFRNTEVNSEAE